MSDINEKNPSSLVSALEAVLFIFGEAVDIKKLSNILSVSEEEVLVAAKDLSSQLSSSDRGIMLMEKEGKYMLSTKPQHALLIEKFVTENLKEDLTPAALETLSIVAYFGPLTRAQIDYLRGVNSSFILRSLLIRGLVERKTGKGLAFNYEVTFDFLKFLGINHVSKMPQYDEYQKLKDQYFSGVINEEQVTS
ncbi:MAG TPA: SMC-Scp complex subunit ScpB [Candidatus Paceibacterota bacterium]|nr:SMC-Scp complex subunit ScpB [Candidatus Paceibacterota bacterium]